MEVVEQCSNLNLQIALVGELPCLPELCRVD
jgi:hypothetical protein